jgi:hypothetical protein
MNRCRYNRPDIIAAYYDGVLPEEEITAFEAHLYTCAECMDALVSLEKDSFLMQRMRAHYMSAPPAEGRAFFKMVKNGIRLVRNLAETPGFEQMLPVPARGGRESTSRGYTLVRGKITVSVRGGEGDRFDLEISGIRGKRTSLYCSGMLIEAHALSKRDTVCFYRLPKGAYRLAVECEDPAGEYLFDFTVR